MASIIPEEQKKKQTAFGDAASGLPAPLPMLTAGTPPIPQTAGVRANEAAARVAAQPPAGLDEQIPFPAPRGAPTGGQPPAGNPSQFLQQPGAGRGVVSAPGVQPAALAAAPAAAPAAPLDAQAAADRGVAGGVWGGIKDANNRAGAAIMDVATLAPRGILGAYDSAVVRPARAAGVDMAYTSPLLTPAGSDPASMTPYYDRIRAADAAGAPAQVAGAVGTGPAPSAAPVAAGAPAAAAVPAAGAVRAPAAAVAAPAVAPTEVGGGAVAAGTPSGAVTRVGNSYSGTNVSGDITVNGAAPGGGFTSMSGAAMARGAPGAAAAAPAAPAAVAPGAGLTVIGDSGAAGRQATADFFTDASQRNNLRAAEGSAGGWRVQGARIAAAQGAIDATAASRARSADGALRDAGETERAGIREQGDDRRATTREAGEQRRADQTDRRYGVRDALDRDELGIKRTAADTTQRAAMRVEAAQLEVQNATTPEARRVATEKLAALSGRAPQDNFAAIEIGGGTEPIDPANPMLGVRTLPKTPVIFNKATGQIVPTPGGAPGAAATVAPAPAIAALKANPALAAQFDQKYGAGASARALGQPK